MQKYKIGIYCESESIPVWLFAVVEQLLDDNGIELYFIIEKLEPAGDFLALYERLNNKVFRSPANAFAAKKIAPGLSIFHKIDWRVLQKNADGKLSESEIPKLNLTVYTHCNGIETIDSIPEDGVLFLFHPNRVPLKKIGMIEYLQNADSVNISICHLRSKKREINTVYHTRSINKSLSPYISRNITFWKVAGAMQTAIEDVRFKRENSKRYRECFAKYDTGAAALGTSVLLKLVLKQGKRLLRRALDRFLFIEQWILLIGKTKNLHSFDMSTLSPCIPPKEKIWADPNVVCNNGHCHIFFEEITGPSAKGHIAVSKLTREASSIDPRVVLEKDYHLSSPFIFSVEDEYYMIPETNENNAIQLYKSRAWPEQWEFQRTLIKNVKAVDSVLHFRNGKWWLFANISRNHGIPLNDELFLFYSDDFFSGKWMAHPQNPIVSDVAKARPAGKIIEHDDKLFRPSQDCSKRYGSAINLNRITILDEESYEERTENYIEPPANSAFLGTHTLNFDRGVVVMDAIRKRRRFF